MFGKKNDYEQLYLDLRANIEEPTPQPHRFNVEMEDGKIHQVEAHTVSAYGDLIFGRFNGRRRYVYGSSVSLNQDTVFMAAKGRWTSYRMVD